MKLASGIVWREMLNRALNSATITSWSAAGVKALLLPVMLPILLTRLNANELQVWFLFAAVASFTSILDLGFSHTFYRLIAFGMAGAKREALLKTRLPNDQMETAHAPNVETISAVFSLMVYIYGFLSLVFVVAFALGGALALDPAVRQLVHPGAIWAVWPAVVLITVGTFFGSIFGVYLQGVNCIAEMRRWDTLIESLSGVALISALLAGAGLPLLLVIRQSWGLVGVGRYFMLARSVRGGQFRNFRIHSFDAPLFGVALAPSWRSGVGAFASLGIEKLCLVLFPRFFPAAQAAALLLAVQILDQLSTFSMAPFYVKLPLFSMFQIRGERQELIRQARRAMFFSHICLLGPGLLIGFIGTPILRLIGSHTAFVGLTLWTALLLGYWLKRYGAMHIQLYSTTNHIIWHYANGAAGAILITSFLLLVNTIHAYAYAVAFTAAYGLVYMPITVWYSLNHLQIGLIEFERQNAWLAGLFLVAVALVLLLAH